MENIFGKFDNIAKLDAFLYDPKFGMAIANSKETFDKFLVRFISAIALFDFIDWYKISNLWQILNKWLWFKIADNIIYTLFSQYVSYYYQYNLDHYQADGFRTSNKEDKSKKMSLRLNIPKSKIRNQISCLDNEYYELGNLVNFFFHSGYLKEH